MTTVELLRQLIRFDTIDPPGNEGPCVEWIRRLLAEAGRASSRTASSGAAARST